MYTIRSSLCTRSEPYSITQWHVLICPLLWTLPCCTDLLHHRLSHRPQLGCLLKLLLLHSFLHRLRCTADVRQAEIIQQRLHSKGVAVKRTSSTTQYDVQQTFFTNNYLPTGCYLQWCRGTVPRSWQSLWWSRSQFILFTDLKIKPCRLFSEALIIVMY